ncbi:MAG: hypothetical protein IT458_19680 [Planctomycetes bacterium]|nr:hypothetical protein [Planctomycetota bacterium]
MAHHRRSWFRRQWIVDRSFQLDLIWRATLLTLGVLVLLTLGVFVPLLHQSSAEGPDPIRSTDAAVVLLYMHERFWAIAAACLVVAVLGALVISHRIAGPLVRFKRHLRMLGEGRVPEPLRTRRHDYLKPEVEVLNETMAKLAEHFAALRSAQAAVVHALARAEARAAFSTDAELRDALQASGVAASHVRAALERFRRVPDQSGDRVQAPPAEVVAQVH